MSETIPAETALPEALTDRDQWLCWRAEERDGKMTKVPVDPQTGSFGSTTNSSTWSDFETAFDRAQTETIDGLGFVFTDDDPIVGVDLDGCRIPETGKTREWAEDIIDRLDSFTEISPSETGYHVLVEGSLPSGRNRKGDVELYETARFFTVTGDHVEWTPESIEPRTEELESVYRDYLEDETEQNERSDPVEKDSSQVTHPDSERTSSSDLSDKALIERAKSASNGEKFKRLYRGRTAGYESNSEADMALCALLAFWTGGDASQIDRIFRTSGLYRDKWDEKHYADGSTYGEKTIERAIAGTSDFYEPPADADETLSAPENDISSTPESDIATESIDSDRNGGTRSQQTPTFEREADYIDRLETLESELQKTLNEADQLREELERERTRRRELEDELEMARQTEDDEGRWWLPW